MPTATTILATAHTTDQIRRAARQQCVGMEEKRNANYALFWSQYRFGDSSQITIDGNKITIGVWVMQTLPVVRPSKRRCSLPSCRSCNGTGLDSRGQVYAVNDQGPF
ncbi:hypothetical protein K32_48520 [Kaistia sp. 32K]|uniref:hypothetical protein n=1 Tax=Kaistia sp. 32K TaxID=2795690 RepID=UPI001915D0DD|nr:hypothetical protein [Kaistia sp. 32K]BCP56235.1 hypothetical protein K32_48520 [Kaistia sp. 32K]